MREKAAPSHFEVQFTRHLQNGIANAFSFQPPKILTPKQIIRGINFLCFSIFITRGHPISIGKQDGLMHFFQRPSRANEFRCEPIEKLRICRRCASTAKIGGGFDNAFAKVMMPEPVYSYARC